MFEADFLECSYGSEASLTTSSMIGCRCTCWKNRRKHLAFFAEFRERYQRATQER